MADLSAVLCDHVQEAGGGGGVGWGLQPADGQVFQAAGQLSGRCAGQVDPHPAALKKRKFVRKSGNLPEKKKKLPEKTRKKPYIGHAQFLNAEYIIYVLYVQELIFNAFTHVLKLRDLPNLSSVI